MPDIDLKQLEGLFDKKLAPISKGLSSVKTELAGINSRLDLVAAHLENVDERLTNSESRLDTIDEALKTVLETQQDQGEQLIRIERKVSSHDERIEVLETKTAHLPSTRS